MRINPLTAAAALAAALSLPGVAMAHDGMTTADVNLRTGPGLDHDVITTVGDEQAVEIEGCMEDGQWCEVSWQGSEGWMHSDYVAVIDGGTEMTIGEARTAGMDVPVAHYPMDVGSPEVAPRAEGGDDLTTGSALSVPDYSTDPEAPPVAAAGRDDDGGELEGAAMPVPEYPMEPGAPEVSPSRD